MTCKHEWIKHPNNELLEMCRLCDKERTKGKESQKIPDVVLSKEDIEESLQRFLINHCFLKSLLV